MGERGSFNWGAFTFAAGAGAATSLALAAPQATGRPALWAFLALAAVILSTVAGGPTAAFVGAAAALGCGILLVHAGAPAILAVASLGLAIVVLEERGRRLRRRASAVAAYLREREVHLQSILDISPDGMVVFDARGVVRAFSATAERQFGWSAADAIGAGVEQFLPEARRMAVGGDLEPRTTAGARRDGASFPVELGLAESGLSGRRFFTAFVRDLSRPADAAARLDLLQSELRHVSRLTAMREVVGGDDLADPLAAIAQRLADLSARERQVLEGLVAGQANKAIAFALSISPRTVEIYRAKLMSKMKAKSLSELVRMAVVVDG